MVHRHLASIRGRLSFAAEKEITTKIRDDSSENKIKLAQTWANHSK